MDPNLALPNDNKLALNQLGELANQVASIDVFQDYRSRKAENTIRRQDADLALFRVYLDQKGADPGDLTTNPQNWEGITWGLVRGFVLWQINIGYAMSTVNFRLSTIKVYAKMAALAGSLNENETALIIKLSGYQLKEAKRIDRDRRKEFVPTRIGSKKSEPVSITPEQARMFLYQPDTPQGRRDALMMSLLLDLGLRVGEVVLLNVEDFDIKAGEVTFHRPKVDMVQTHRLPDRLLRIARRYLAVDALERGRVLRKSLKNGELHTAGLTERAVTKRVEQMGKEVGLVGLSAHDCRHHWATQAARRQTPLDRLREAGGWSSLAMPVRYIEASRIANEGVVEETDIVT